MDPISFLLVAGTIAFFCFAIYTANLDDLKGQPFAVTKYLLYALIFILFSFALMLAQFWVIKGLNMTIPPDSGIDVSGINAEAALAASLLSVGVAIFTGLLVIRPASRRLIRFTVGSGSFNPDSTVHITAFVLCLTLICVNFGQFVLNGGIEGMATGVEQETNFIGSTLFQEVLWLLAAFLGIGLFLRRTPQAALERLGLRDLQTRNLISGFAAGIGMLIVVYAFGTIWASLVSPEVFEQQNAASSEIAAAVNSLPAALLVSLLVAVGEEIFFRGALQPIFGLGATSIFFTLLHLQYTLTPASLLILAVAFILGVVRQRYGTSAAIVAHFTYDFSQLALAVLTVGLIGGRF
ncbi:MAG: CPBP family intramembrane glutamic endopeptidase [Anaerolineae bacterium]